MKKYLVKAYGEEYGLPTKSAVIEAESRDEALAKAWRMFPEYEDVYAAEVSE